MPFDSPGYLIDLSKSITGSATSVAVGTAPAHGKVVVSALGATYTPTTGYAGSDSFTYTATGVGGTSAAATVTITVQGLPDPTADPDVTGIIGAEGDEVDHFTDLQVSDVNNHLEGLHDGAGGGGGGVNLTLASQGGGAPVPGSADQGAFNPASVTLGNILRAADGDAAKPVAAWITGGVQFGKLSGTAQRATTQSTTIGLTSGVDFRIDRNLTLGGGVGYNQDDAKIGSNGSKVASHGYFGIAYGSYHPQVAGLYLDGQVGYGGLHFDSRRFVTYTGSTAAGSRNGGAWFGSATFGSEQQAGDVRWAPYARLVAMAGTLNAFTETGGGVYNLAYSSQKVSSTSIAVGVRASEAVALGDGVLTPRARLEYIGSVTSADTVSLTYPALISSPIYGLSENLLDSAQTVLGVGAGYHWKNGMSVSADYTGTVSYVSRNTQRVIFGFKAPF